MSTAKDAGGEVSAAAKDQSSRRALLKSGALAGVAAVGGLLSSQRAEGAEEESTDAAAPLTRGPNGVECIEHRVAVQQREQRRHRLAD